MTHKDCRLLAGALRNCLRKAVNNGFDCTTVEEVIGDITLALQGAHSTFDTEQFLLDCGLDKKRVHDGHTEDRMSLDQVLSVINGNKLKREIV